MNEIVVGVDGSDESRAALAWAVEEARLRRVPVLAIHAWELPVVPTATGLVPPSVDIVADLSELREGAVELVDTIVREVRGQRRGRRGQAGRGRGASRSTHSSTPRRRTTRR